MNGTKLQNQTPQIVGLPQHRSYGYIADFQEFPETKIAESIEMKNPKTPLHMRMMGKQVVNLTDPESMSITVMQKELPEGEDLLPEQSSTPTVVYKPIATAKYTLDDDKVHVERASKSANTKTNIVLTGDRAKRAAEIVKKRSPLA